MKKTIKIGRPKIKLRREVKKPTSFAISTNVKQAFTKVCKALEVSPSCQVESLLINFINNITKKQNKQNEKNN